MCRAPRGGHMQRPRLKTTTEVFSSPGGDICLLRPSADSDLVLEDAGDRDRELVARLDGRTPRALLDAEFGGEAVGELIGLLDAEGLLEDAGDYDDLDGTERGRYDRQLRYFADLAPVGLVGAGLPAAAAGGRACWCSAWAGSGAGPRSASPAAASAS